MEKTVYGVWEMNESQRKLCKYALYAAAGISFGIWTYGEFQGWTIRWLPYFVTLFWISALCFDQTFESITIDEEAGTITQVGTYPDC